MLREGKLPEAGCDGVGFKKKMLALSKWEHEDHKEEYYHVYHSCVTSGLDSDWSDALD